VTDGNLIATEDLVLAHVPPSDAELQVLEEFCLTIDGYQGGRFTPDDLLKDAEHVERAGLKHVTLHELRTVAFIRQRELRWTSMDFGHFDEHLVRSIRALIEEIRRRLEPVG
jgi:hypothetical protein